MHSLETQKQQPLRFWTIFALLHIATLFIPVFPIYRDSVRVALLPVWSMYLSFIAPAFLPFSLPVVATHLGATCLIARRLSTHFDKPIKFSILSIFAAVTVFAVALSLVMFFGPEGFIGFFHLAILTIVVANVAKQQNVLGLQIPKLGRKAFIAIVVSWVLLLTFTAYCGFN